MKNSICLSRSVVASSLLAAVALSAPALAGVSLPHYVNGTNNWEANYVALQFPSSFVVTTGSPTPVIYGQIYNFQWTESGGPNPAIVAQFGYGPIGSNPLVNDAGWVWSNAGYNVQVGNNDEYQTSIIAPAFGDYAYTYRFNLNPGFASSNVGWTLADLNGAGNNQGLSYDPAQLGVMHVIPTPSVAAVMGLGALAGLRRRR